MKPLMTAVLLYLAAVPAIAQTMNVGSMVPTMTYPGDAPETVTQDDSDVNK
jgi:hypothetical protein